jgi:hypothetical protein
VNPGTYTNTVRGSVVSTSPPCTSTTSGIGLNTVGCSKIQFTNQNNGTKTFNVTNCVSERTGTEAFTDTAYSAASGNVGWVYSNGSENPCLGQTIQPLTSDKTVLHNKIATLVAANSTAGHIGLAWGWYMVSPNWAPLVPTASQPAAYGTSHLIKVVILMTDGAFNTDYCKGVISQDAGSGSGSASNHINCNAPNGDSFTQAQTLCNNMKHLSTPVVIYTVGFDVSTDPSAVSVLSNCATDASHVYFPADDGTSLQVAFQQIAADLNHLRISH